MGQPNLRDTARPESGSLHRLVHSITEKTVRFIKARLPNLPPYSKAHFPRQQDLTVFLHIPRTSGDAMRTHLFNAAEWDFTPFETPPKPLGPAELNVLSEHRLIKGFLSINDVEGLPNRRVFNFLRDPVERSLSLYYFLRYGRRPTKRVHTIEEFFTSDHPLLASYARNGMTWQLGDTLNIARRTLTEEVALARAKETLKSLDFVGFYEDLGQDFKALRQSMFPELRIHPFFPFLFQLGACLALHRRRVRKYASTVTPAQLTCLLRQSVLHPVPSPSRGRPVVTSFRKLGLLSPEAAETMLSWPIRYRDFIVWISLFAIYRLHLKETLKHSSVP